MAATLQPFNWDRVVSAVEKVRERRDRTARILEAAEIPYAVIGGHAVAAWVSRVDEAAVRFTRDVDILLRRGDLPRAVEAMEAAGFTFRHVRGVDMFLDGPDAKARDAVHVLIAAEPVKAGDAFQTPDVSDVTQADGFRALELEPLVRMKLMAWRRKDQTHLEDMIGLGLLDESWPARFPGELGDRLQSLLDDPDG